MGASQGADGQGNGAGQLGGVVEGGEEVMRRELDASGGRGAAHVDNTGWLPGNRMERAKGG